MGLPPDGKGEWCRLRFRSADGREAEDPLLLTTTPLVFDVDRLALYLSRPVLEWEFHPTSPWAETQLLRPLPPGPASWSCDSLTHEFRQAIARTIGSAQKFAVALSGGLDSAAVLYHAQAVAKHRGLELFALVIPAQDDRGEWNVPVATRLAELLAPDSTLAVAPPPDETDWRGAWNPIGPTLESTPAKRAAANREADRLGAELILTGIGADELLGAPKYLLSKLARRPLDARSYLRDLKGVTSPAAWLLELLAVAATILPKHLDNRLYLAVNNPEICSIEPSPLLAAERVPRVADWTRAWLRNIVEPEEGASRQPWSSREALDSLYPYDLLAPAGPTPERSPFLDSQFVALTRSLPLTARYDAGLPTPYQRRKALVVSLYPEWARAHLPEDKQLYRADLARYQAEALTRLPKGRLVRSVELGLVREDATTDDEKGLAWANAIERWIIEAESQGASAR